MDTVELIQIQSLINDLSKKIDSLVKENIVLPDPYRSEEIKDLAAALAKAQGEMYVANKNKNNPYFKSAYADLEAIVAASRPALTQNGISITQDILDDADGAKWLITLMLHNSGQWMHSKCRIVPPKNDIQSISSCITYMKRICYASLVGVVTSDEDDDGEAAVATTRDTFAKGTALNTKYNPRETSPEVISKDQLAEIEYELVGYPEICEMVLDGLKIQSLADMPKEKYSAAAKRIREIKLIREGKA